MNDDEYLSLREHLLDRGIFALVRKDGAVAPELIMAIREWLRENGHERAKARKE